MVSLRDGRRFYGILRSFDQFANLVLQDTVERLFIDDAYGEEPRGVYIVRGENVALIGQLDPDLVRQAEETRQPGSLASLTRIPYPEVHERWKEMLETKKSADFAKAQQLKKQGMIFEYYADNLY